MSISNVFDNKLYELLIDDYDKVNNKLLSKNDKRNQVINMNKIDKIKLMHKHPVLLCKLYIIKN